MTAFRKKGVSLSILTVFVTKLLYKLKIKVMTSCCLLPWADLANPIYTKYSAIDLSNAEVIDRLDAAFSLSSCGVRTPKKELMT